VQAANLRIHERSHSHAEQAGMGTTLTAAYVGAERVSIAHVGDSRAYCLRDGQLVQLTDDHSLVDELMRQGRLTPEEAVEHPQRSVITRALGPELAVDVDTSSYVGRAGDVYLLCSDGLTTMVGEDQLAALLLANPRLRGAGEALIAAANAAGGRDNITVVLIRLEEVQVDQPAPPASAHPDGAEDGRPPQRETASAAQAVAVPVRPRQPRLPIAGEKRPARGSRALRRAGALAAVLVAIGAVGAGAYIALQSVYFIGTNSRGLITVYRGVPYRLPGNLSLYSSDYVSGVSASTLTPERRHALLDHSLRSQGSAAALVRSLELGELE